MERVGFLVSGYYPFPEDAELLDIETPWGSVTARLGGPGRGHVFVARHGDPHAPPHRVRHRANVDALRRCGATRIFAVNSVGALKRDAPVPSFLVPHDLVDFTHHAETTFHENGLFHVDMTEPYCAQLRAALAHGAKTTGVPTLERGVYAMTRGPRLETSAEVRALATMGDVVGMTGGPEATLAREAGLCYASLCVVVNHAAGLGPRLSQEGILTAYRALAGPTALAIEKALPQLTPERTCACAQALPGAHP